MVATTAADLNLMSPDPQTSHSHSPENPMRVFIITQNELFYLPGNLEQLIAGMPADMKLVGAIVLYQSPFKKKMGFKDRALETYRTFGLKFFLTFATRFVLKKLSRKNLYTIFAQHDVPVVDVHTTINSNEAMGAIRKLAPDVIVSIAANQIFKQPLLDLPTHGCVNLHSALLPKNRGIMPVFWSMKNQDGKTGVSVFLMDKGIDSGPILVQKVAPIHETDTLDDAIARVKPLGMQAILEALAMLRDGGYTTQANDEADATYFSMPERQDVVEFLKTGHKLV